MITQLEDVRAKVREAIGVPTGSIVYGRPVMLHDVLRATGKSMGIHGDGEMMRHWTTKNPLQNGRRVDHTEFSRDVRWNLALPLDEQEPEVIGFLYKILYA
jgi:hypothetical protein